jgi:hypothetical protein
MCWFVSCTSRVESPAKYKIITVYGTTTFIGRHFLPFTSHITSQFIDVDVHPKLQLSPPEHPEVLLGMEPSHYHLKFYLYFCEHPCLSGTLVPWIILGDFGLVVVLPHYFYPCQLFSHIAFLHIICSIMLPSFTSVGLSYYLSQHQLLWHVTFLHVSCPATLSSSTSFILSHYLSSHQLSCHFTFFHISCPATLPFSISVVL